MGCHSTKPLTASAVRKPPRSADADAPLSPAFMDNSASPGSPAQRLVVPLSPTLLDNRTVELPTLDVQVLKPDNALKQLMTAHEPAMFLPPVREMGHRHESVLDPLVRKDAPTMAEVETEPPSSRKPLSETTNIASNVCGKLSPSCCMSSKTKGSSQRRRRSNGCNCCEDDDVESESPTNRKRPKGGEPGKTLENLIQELFVAHDLNCDGFLDEAELISLNQAVAEAHDSRDSESIRRKYSVFFREKLDPEGRPVPYATFRRYILEMLDAIDRNELAQEMMIEQFLAEARLARTVVTGAPLLVDRPRPKNFYNACLHFCPEAEAANEALA